MTTVLTEVPVADAERGTRTIELRVRFWTNGIASAEGKIVPRHAWDSGTVEMRSNESHGIVAKQAYHFYSLAELPSVIEKALISNGVRLHADTHSRKLFA
ncbi:MAG TPA: hypothetical protein VFT35_05895 [Gaiellaceae bacterium]|jgi:hypothetical protein|nr:hypothetical protein [Gaiellaceae bacterium]